ncbi:MAG: hypothetical protein NVS3B12_32080 [Acidimicrobiales bacterium]
MFLNEGATVDARTWATTRWLAGKLWGRRKNAPSRWMRKRSAPVAILSLVMLGACTSSTTKSASSAATTQPVITTTSSATASLDAQRTQTFRDIKARCRAVANGIQDLPKPGGTAASMVAAATGLQQLLADPQTAAIKFPEADSATRTAAKGHLDAASADLAESIRRAESGDIAGSQSKFDVGDHFKDSAKIYAYYGAECAREVPAAHGQVQPDAVINVGRFPWAATADGRGSVWVGLWDDRTVVRVDAKTNAVVAKVAVDDDNLQKIQITPDGVWVRGRLAMHRIDPTTNAVAQTIPKSTIGSAVSRVFVQGNDLWACDGNALVRAATTDGHTLARIDLPWSCGSIAATPDQVWVTAGQRLQADMVRIDPATNTVVARVALSGENALIPRIGAKDVWTCTGGTKDFNAIRVDSTTNKVTQTIPLPSEGCDEGAEPALGARGYYIPINGTVQQVSTATNQFGPTLDGGAMPVGTTIDGDTLWVTNRATNELRRFTIK